jgi:hypothetical protein
MTAGNVDKTFDRIFDLLREANRLAAAPLVDAERRAAFLARKRELLADLNEVTR